jgi:hypothetical protein
MAPLLKGKMDLKMIGVGGHSFGAYTSEAIAGALVQIKKDAAPASFADKRVAAVIAMSPEGPGQIGFVDNSWGDQPVKLMRGRCGFAKSPSWRKIPFDRSPAGDKYHLLIEGANHFSFVGHAGDDADKGAIFSHVKVSSLVFWEAYLKHDAKALDYLKSNALAKSSDGMVSLYRKVEASPVCSSRVIFSQLEGTRCLSSSRLAIWLMRRIFRCCTLSEYLTQVGYAMKENPNVVVCP